MKRAITGLSILGMFLALGLATSVRADEQCTLRSISGDWGYEVTGVRNPYGPAASVGSFHLDQDGNLAGTQTLSINGTIVQGEVLTGTTTVNSDCTGAMVIVVSNTPFPRISTLNVIFTDSSRHAYSIFTNAGTVLTTHAEKIHQGND